MSVFSSVLFVCCRVRTRFERLLSWQMSDIDRVPELPASKKEFFETSIFKPQMRGTRHFPVTPQECAKGGSSRPSVTGFEKPSDTQVDNDNSSVEGTHYDKGDEATIDGDGSVPHSESGHEDHADTDSQPQKEVTGRGKGAFQYRGRHFICIRDPFEKERTIGPPFYCQSHISTEILSALQLFGWARRKEEEENGSAVDLMKSLFIPRTGHTYGHIYHPFKEALKDVVNGITEEAEQADQMYSNIAYIIRSHGSYNNLFDQRRPVMEARQQTQSQPPAGRRQTFEYASPYSGPVAPPPGFQEEPSERRRSSVAKPSSPNLEQAAYESAAVPSVGSPAPMATSVDGLVAVCPHFRLNMGNVKDLETHPNTMKRFRTKDFPDPLAWLRSRNDILCRCSKEGTVCMPLEMDRYDRIAQSLEKSIPFAAQAWPPKAPPTTRKPEETFLLNLIHGKATDLGNLDLNSRPEWNHKGEGYEGPVVEGQGRSSRGGSRVSPGSKNWNETPYDGRRARMTLPNFKSHQSRHSPGHSWQCNTVDVPAGNDFGPGNLARSDEVTAARSAGNTRRRKTAGQYRDSWTVPAGNSEHVEASVPPAGGEKKKERGGKRGSKGRGAPS